MHRRPVFRMTNSYETVLHMYEDKLREFDDLPRVCMEMFVGTISLEFFHCIFQLLLRLLIKLQNVFCAEHFRPSVTLHKQNSVLANQDVFQYAYYKSKSLDTTPSHPPPPNS